uniref:Uncharacterized protein n=1 Tax=Neogobius melanostomus TaxID=47308 RepID=A0A8C6TT58_9GOBI
MRNIFNFRRLGQERRCLSENRDVAPGRSAGYELKDRDLGKIHKAASVGDLAKLKELLKQGKDINQTDKKLRTALHVACAVGCVDVVQFLQGRTALMKAVQSQHEACVHILLENNPEADLADGDGNTALHFSANLPSVTVTQLLLMYGVDLNTSNQEGLTPLSLAVREGHREIVQLLLKEGADVNVFDCENRTPLMIAEEQGMTAMTQLLLKQNKKLRFSLDNYSFSESDDDSLEKQLAPHTQRFQKLQAQNAALINLPRPPPL